MSDNTNQMAEFGIENITLKNLQVNVDNPAYTFRDQWKPKAQIELDSHHEHLKETLYHVTMTVSVSVESNEKKAFSISCQTAGVFHVKDFPPAQLDEVLKSHCLNILFPFARQSVSDAINKAGFPILHLNPIDFHAQYRQHQLSKSQKNEKKTSSDEA